jgi:uncharacterized membrane protein
VRRGYSVLRRAPLRAEKAADRMTPGRGSAPRRFWLARPLGPLGWLRSLFLCLVLAASAFNAALVALGGAPWSTRLPALIGLVGLVVWWVVGFRRGRFPALGAPAEALALGLVSVATVDGQRAIGLIYAALLLRAAYGAAPAIGLAVAAHAAAFLGALFVAPPAAGNGLALGAALAVGAIVVGVGAPVVVRALEGYERTVAEEIEERRREREKAILAAEGRPTTHIECVATFGRPVEEVFAFVADPTNGPAWQGWLASATVDPPGPIAVGTKVAEVRQILGIRVGYVYRITALEPNRRIALESVDGPVPFSAQFTFEPVGQGCLVRVGVDVRTASLVGVFGPAHPLIGRMAERELQANLANLNDLLYAHALKD